MRMKRLMLTKFSAAIPKEGLLTLCLAVCLLALCLPASAQSNVTFDAPGAGTSAGQGTQAFAINPEGVVAGISTDSSFVNHGFVRTNHGALTTFDAPGAGTGPNAPGCGFTCQGTYAFSINAEGVIVGYHIDSGFVVHGFVRTARGAFTTFDVPGAGTGAGQGTYSWSVNSEGVIAGYYVDDNTVAHGFLRAQDGTFTSFDVLGAGTSPFEGTFPTSTIGLNDAGTISGNYVDTNFVSHGFLRPRNGVITTFDAPGAGTNPGQGTFNLGLNQEGTTIGYYFDSNFVFHGYARTPDGAIATFESPGSGTGLGQGTLAEGINPEGTIEGEYIDANNVNHGYVRGHHGKFTFFDVSGAGTSAFQGTIPVSINPSGAITGYSVDSNGVFHGFLRNCKSADDDDDETEHEGPCSSRSSNQP